MSIFTFILDSAVHNTYALFQKLRSMSQGSDNEIHKIKYREFKRRIAESLVSAGTENGTGKSEPQEEPAASIEMQSGTILSDHVLLQNLNKKRTQCYLCLILSDNGQCVSESMYGCMQCKKAYHVNCFALYHYRDALKKSDQHLEK